MNIWAPESSASGSLTGELLQLIAEGDITRDGWLRETDAARMLGVSRTPIRAALRELAGMGVVVLEPNRGARVRAYSSTEIEEIYRSRALVEPYVVGIAVPRFRPHDLDMLRDLSARMRALEAGPSYSAEVSALNREFHMRFIQVARDHPLAGAAVSMLVPLLLQKVMHSYDATQSQRSMDQHDELITAAEFGDAQWAASIMKTHILGGLNQFKRAVSVELNEPPN